MGALKRFATYRGTECVIYETASPSDLFDIEPTAAGARHFTEDPSFYGFEDWSTVRADAASETNERYLAEVQKVLDQVNVTVNVETNAYLIDNAIVGFIPDVPAAIQNLPECMVMVEPTQSDLAPVNVYVAGSISAGLDLRLVAKRGAAVVALISKLQMIRPVNLTFVKGNGNHFGLVPIPTRPMNLAQISYMLCNGGFMRWCIFTLTHWTKDHVPFDCIFTAHSHQAQSKNLARDMITFLGGDPEHDIYVPPLHISDPLLKDPVAWVETTLAQYLRQD